MQLDVIYEDNHLLAINKPAMLPTMGVSPDRPSLISIAKAYIKRKYQKPGNVYLGVVSRLDAPVTGVLLIARTSKAAARLNRQFRQRQVQKVYWALVQGMPEAVTGECRHWLRKDERHRRMHVTRSGEADAQEAVLQYTVIRKINRRTTLLQVQLETGRKHQIRVQLAALGHPILGDRKYGGDTRFPLGIALHSRCLTLQHPVRNQQLGLTAPLPPSWDRFLSGDFHTR